MKNFGVMLDMSRNAVMKPGEVVKFAKIIKSFGYNMIQLYTEDTYQVEDEPYFGYMRGRYTFEEQRYMVEECEKIGVEVVPCIQTLAHLNQIFRWEKYFSINDTNDILFAGEEKTYTLIENMIKTLRKNFKSHYIHIGMDEAGMLGLGKYLEKHGFKNRFEILKDHLSKVVAICEKYDFKPIMWSDMFFKLSNKGEYYSENPIITDETIKLTPKNVGLVFWDYYHDNKNIYDKMTEAHQKFKNEIWFAGGAWTWVGFTPCNQLSLKTMKPAMLSAREHNIENIFITMWGDDGKECSYYAVLSSLFAIKKFYDGVTDMDTIKKEFNELTGENFDDIFNLDLPNCICGNKESARNPSKYMLYNDIFNGVFDSSVLPDGKEDYKKFTKELHEAGLRSKNFGYIFESLSSLCNVLSIKYDLGVRLRKAYKEGNKAELENISKDITTTLERLDVFYDNFSKLWYKENKPQGFDVQDIRLGGLMQRLKACKKRLDLYIDGTYKNIPELEEEVIGWSGKEGSTGKEEIPLYNSWKITASTSVI